MASTVSDKRVTIKKRLSDSTCYTTRIGSQTHVLSFKNDHFAELKDLLKYMTGVINSFGLNHIFIKDIRSIVKVLESRVFPNNWAICITTAELQDIIFRLTTLHEYIRDSCLPNMDSKVLHFCTDVLDDDHQFLVDRK